jgi:diphosphomevalonate decarboxylase
MEISKTTAVSHPNVALIKYWGNFDARLRMPLNDSLSMNLDALTTETTVEFDDALENDEVLIGGEPADERAAGRVIDQLNRIRSEAKITSKARVHSRSNFPSATGLASSASAYAALALAASRAAGLELSERNLSILARHGSGSAARSIPSGFVEWLAATNMTSTSDQSYARQLMPADAWDLKDVIAIVSRDPKKVGSSEGHAVVNTSPFLGERLSRLPIRYHRVRRELLNKNLKGMGNEIEAEAIELHMLAMTSRPPIFYWAPATVRVMDAVRQWRDEGLTAYYTLDAGPNVHILTEAANAEEVANRLKTFADVQEVIISGAGQGARLTDDHLF